MDGPKKAGRSGCQDAIIRLEQKYTYTSNDPLDKTDPSGKYLCTMPVGGWQTCISDGTWGDKIALIGHAVAAYANSALQSIGNALPSSGDKPSSSQDQGAPSDANAPNSNRPTPPEKPSLIDDERATHILDGDATGGGHRGGTGEPNK